MVNLGDLLSGPLQPAETADLLMTLDLLTIAGNHERQLLTLAPEQMGASDAYARSRLTDRHRAWLASLPATARVGDDVILCHGTPDSDLTYFLEAVTPSGAREATDEEVEARAGAANASLILCGHTHMPLIRALNDERLVVNPGAVGLPAFEDDRLYVHAMQVGTPHASYAVCTRDPAGRWEMELVRVAFNRKTAARLAEGRGRGDRAVVLRTGTALTRRTDTSRVTPASAKQPLTGSLEFSLATNNSQQQYTLDV